MAKFATSTEVREFAIAEGLAQPGRGRLSKAAVEAFNKANPRRKYVGQREPVLTLKAKPEKGRTRTRKATASEVREFAVAHGLAKPTRGRISNEAKRAFVLGVENA